MLYSDHFVVIVWILGEWWITLASSFIFLAHCGEAARGGHGDITSLLLLLLLHRLPLIGQPSLLLLLMPPFLFEAFLANLLGLAVLGLVLHGDLHEASGMLAVCWSVSKEGTPVFGIGAPVACSAGLCPAGWWD